MTAEDKIGLGILLTLALTGFAAGWWIRRKESTPLAWPQESGMIVTCTTVESETSRGRYASPVIEYAFDYQGQSYKCAHWRVGNFTIGSVESAEAVTARYPVGMPVTVFVNVRQPMKSVLEAYPSALSWVAFGFGIFFMVSFLLAVIGVAREK